jgi:peroxiredoxin/outer membrane lipoprotein-sorting protein
MRRAIVGVAAAVIVTVGGSVLVYPRLATDRERDPAVCATEVKGECATEAAAGQEGGAEESGGERSADEAAGSTPYDLLRETMRKAETLIWEGEYRREYGGVERGRCTYRVWLKKPNYARVEARVEGELRGVLVLDGEHCWIHWPSGRYFRYGWEDDSEYERTRFHAYMKEAAPIGLYSISRRTVRLNAGMSMTIMDPSFFHGTPDLHAHLDGVTRIGTEKVGGEECDLVEASFMGGQRSHYLWLSRRDHLPRKLREVVRAGLEVVHEELWSNVQIDEPMPDDLFAWEPPEEWEEFRIPEREEGLLKPGTEAPDFEVVALDGRRIKLSDSRGKVVWLYFWKVGCPPCRRQMPELEELYKRYRDKGLLVVGLDLVDDREIAAAFLREHGVTFPNIVESSRAVRNTITEKYETLSGMQAVPLDYIIDREGKVADAFYGDEVDRGRAVLEKLGIE